MSRTVGEQAVKHPSGLTWERWNWPFKTPQEREIVAKWFKKQDKSTNTNWEKAPL